MSPMLADPLSFPTDILRIIFNFVDDQGLFSLLHVCHLTRTVGLVVLLMRYRSHIGWNEEVSLASPVVQELQENTMSIYKLHCRFEEVSSLVVLKKILESLPHVECLRVELSQEEPHNESNRHGGPMFLAVILRLLGRMRSTRNAGLVVLDPAGLPETVTAQTMIGHTKKKMDDIPDCDSVHLQSFLRRSLFSSKSILVIYNHLHVTHLMIGYAKFRGALATTIMPLLQLPNLQVLHITKKTRMNAADLFPFLSRHPTIQALTLEHYSLARCDVMQDHGPWPLPGLKSITAPLPYLYNIMKDINLVRRLEYVAIGVPPEDEIITPLYRRLFPISDAFDEKFSFDTLNEVLCTLSESRIISLDLVVPAGVASKEWLTLGENVDERPERRLVHLMKVHVYPETDHRFPDSILGLFYSWHELFPSVVNYSIHYHGRRSRW